MFKRLCKEGYEVLNLQVKKDLTSIVMVSGNPASDYAKECIASLQKYTQPHELIIISTGISKDFNYSREMNRAAQITNGEYLCFVDDDMIFCENWLGYLIEHINSDDKIGVVGIPDLYNYIDKNGEAKRYDPQHPNDVQYVGTLMFMRRETFGNGFDEELASYYTDTDFCFAAREEGLRIDVEPRCKVKHLESATQKQIEGIQDRRAKGKERFMQKWRFML